jgi:hypothetical protein
MHVTQQTSRGHARHVQRNLNLNCTGLARHNPDIACTAGTPQVSSTPTASHTPCSQPHTSSHSYTCQRCRDAAHLQQWLNLPHSPAPPPPAGPWDTSHTWQPCRRVTHLLLQQSWLPPPYYLLARWSPPPLPQQTQTHRPCLHVAHRLMHQSWL